MTLQGSGDAQEGRETTQDGGMDFWDEEFEVSVKWIISKLNFTKFRKFNLYNICLFKFKK